jgi:uncharacterized protein (DUF1778 family)
MVTKGNRRNASKDSPSVSIRFRSRAEMDQLRRAAKVEGMSFNTFVVYASSLKAAEILDAEPPWANFPHRRHKDARETK